MIAAAPFRTLSASDYGPNGGIYRKRKVTGLSKSGCQACKLKKVKCDEERPTCRRCHRNDRRCVYKIQAVDQFVVSIHRDQSAHPLTMHTARFVQPGTPTSKNGTPSLHLLQHLQSNWDAIFPVPESRQILQMTKTNPLVRDVVLAVAACHLRITGGGRSHQLAESFHTYGALQQYRSRLLCLNEQRQEEDISALLVVATLLNLNAFALPISEAPIAGDASIEDSWVFSIEDNRLGWMSLQIGIRPLMLMLMTPSYSQILEYLATIFLGSDNSHQHIRINQAIENLPDHWKEVFQLNQPATATDDASASGVSCDLTNVYHAPAITLANIRHVKPAPVNAFYFMTFLSKTDTRYLSLLQQKDSRAMWLVGYWMGLMARIDGLWWCKDRAKRDYQAICVWFSIRSWDEMSDAWKVLVAELHGLGELCTA